MIFKFIIAVLITAGFVSCSSDDSYGSGGGGSNTTTFRGTLNGSSEVPPTPSGGTGTATLTFDNTTKIATVNIMYSGLTGPATAGHIHQGAVGVSGAPVFAFPSLTSPIIFDTPVLSAAQETTLKANGYYVNLHTSAYPDGEIRGQLIKQSSGSY
ncbi:CHRD domain-containing protein [Flavobacterium pedocola]